MSIAIIGAGLSGSLLLINLAQIFRAKPFQTPIFLIEYQNKHWGRGIAYSSDLPYQPLNVIVAKMNLLTNSPDDFLDWLKANHYDFNKNSFVPRHIFGDFLSQQLAAAEQTLAANLIKIKDKVLNIKVLNSKEYQLFLEINNPIIASKIVLATGADSPAALDENSDRIFNNPYKTDILNQIKANSTLFLLGTGLTMIDWAISLQSRQPKQIIAFSRRGQLPQAHFLQPENWEIMPAQAQQLKNIRQFIQHFQQNITQAQQQKQLAWQSVLDAYRPHLATIWDNFDHENKAIFLRFLRPYWDSLRFRCPQESAHVLAKMQADNLFLPLAGRILSVQNQADFLRIEIYNKNTQQKQKLNVDYLINCTGAANFSSKMPILYQNLIKNGLARIDPHGIGIETNANGLVLAENIFDNNKIYGLGALRKAKEWETGSIQSIRLQAEALAQRLILGEK